jgi:serine/threonine protein phosphatase 1
MMGLLSRLFRSPPQQGPSPRRRLVLNAMPPVLYAIGDVHGCLDLLEDLEAQIIEDADRFGGRGMVVVLGDLIDRGPSSAGVLEHVLTNEYSGLERICLCGNHEDMFLRFLEHPSLDSPWLSFGGQETLNSYGIWLDDLAHQRHLQHRLDAMLPVEHIAWLKACPFRWNCLTIILFMLG